MHYKHFISFIFLILLLAASSVGCSGSDGTAIIPSGDDTPVKMSNDAATHVLWGIWGVNFDTSELQINIKPVRNALAHYNITDLLLPPNCDDCLEFAVNSFDPVTRILDVDVVLRNKYPLTGHDVRGILYTNDYGHLLRNADAWTGLWDIPGGMDINRFKAFAKDEPNRVFVPDAEHVENFLIYIPIPPYWNEITFAVDASWPGNCREPYAIEDFMQLGELFDFTGATVDIQVEVHDWQGDVSEVLLHAPVITGEDTTQFTYDSGDLWTMELVNNTGALAGDHEVMLSATSTNSPGLSLYNFAIITITEEPIPVVVTAIDPDNAIQGENLTDVTISGGGFVSPVKVRLKKSGEPDIIALAEAVVDPSTITCDIGIPFFAAPGYYDVEVWNGTGEYGTGEGLFLVNPATSQLVDVTPDCLNFSPQGVFVSGNYAYIAAGENGLCIFDITDPLNPLPVIEVDTHDHASGVAVNGDYAYVWNMTSSGGFEIFDISVPESPLLVNMVDTIKIEEMVIEDGYAYFANGELHIFDVDPPESASEVKSVPVDILFQHAYKVAVNDGYAYMSSYDTWDEDPRYFHVVDIDPPDSAHIVKSLEIGLTGPRGIEVKGEYVFLLQNELHIYDVIPPEDTWKVHSADGLGNLSDMELSGDYIYATKPISNSLVIVDIDPVFTTQIVDSVDVTIVASRLDVSGNYAYVCDPVCGLSFIDISTPDSGLYVNTIYTPGQANRIDVADGYAHIVGARNSVMTFDINTPASAHHVNTLFVFASCNDIAVSDGYLYASHPDCIYIFDITQIDAPFPAKIMTNLDYVPFSLCVNEGYLYFGQAEITDFYFGIIDVDPPGLAQLVNTVTDVDYVRGIAVQDDYAYVANTLDFKIVDISVPESAFLVNTVDTPGLAYGVDVQGDYAYISDNLGNLQIIDINPLDSAYLLKEIYLQNGEPVAVSVGDGYACVVSEISPIPGAGRLNMMDIDPPEDAYIVDHIELPDWGKDIVVDGQYAYVAAYTGGLRIIKLW